jgi:hypothetical protein
MCFVQVHDVKVSMFDYPPDFYRTAYNPLYEPKRSTGSILAGDPARSPRSPSADSSSSHSSLEF